MSVRLHLVSRYRDACGSWPASVDSSGQFDWYKARDEDLSTSLLAPVDPQLDLDPIHFDHRWQYDWYARLPLDHLNAVARSWCWPSARVVDRAAQILRTMEGRAAVLYRGNDKVNEIGHMPYQSIIRAAERSGLNRFWVQTDEAEFLEAFRERFPDTTALDSLRRISRDPQGTAIPPEPADRPAFAIEFLAALYAVGQSPALITTTGNTGLWAVIYRGHGRNLWQLKGRVRRGTGWRRWRPPVPLRRRMKSS
jgi:hypothetical protein